MVLIHRSLQNLVDPDFDDESNAGSNALTALVGERWRNVRARVSPAFTSQKIKLMVISSSPGH